MEITELFNKFINVYEGSQIPNWITIISTVLPIIISLIVLWQNHIISKRNEELQEDLAKKNEKLQKNILNNELKLKKYDIILNAYTAFIDVVEQLPTTENSINSLIIGGKQNTEFVIALIKNRDKILLEKGKIKLLLKEDINLIDKLSELTDLYKTIENELTQAIMYGKIVNVNEIMEKIQKYKELLRYDNYDKYFEKYLTFEEMK